MEIECCLCAQLLSWTRPASTDGDDVLDHYSYPRLVERLAALIEEIA